MTRWTLSIPDETDRTVRTYLARIGLKKGDLSRFVDRAVRRQVFALVVQDNESAVLTLEIPSELREGAGELEAAGLLSVDRAPDIETLAPNASSSAASVAMSFAISDQPAGERSKR